MRRRCRCEDCLAFARLQRERAFPRWCGEEQPTLAAEAPAELTPAASLLEDMLHAGAALRELPLPKSDEASLAREIEHYAATGKIAVAYDDGEIKREG